MKYLKDRRITPVLSLLIVETSKPLASVEKAFAPDSSGFSTCRFVRWFDVKHGVARQEQDWVKAHMICGTKTNVVTAVEIHERLSQDSPILPTVLDTTAMNFRMKEVPCNKGYSSINKVERFGAAGATH